MTLSFRPFRTPAFDPGAPLGSSGAAYSGTRTR